MSLTSHEEVRVAIERTWDRAKHVLTTSTNPTFYKAALERLRVFYSELLDLKEQHPETPLAEGETPGKGGAKGAPAGKEAPEGKEPAGVKEAPEKEEEAAEEEPKELPRIPTPEPRRGAEKDKKKKRKKEEKVAKPSKKEKKSRQSSEEQAKSRSLRSVTPVVTPAPARETRREYNLDVDYEGDTSGERGEESEEERKSPVTPDHPPPQSPGRRRDSRSRSLDRRSKPSRPSLRSSSPRRPREPSYPPDRRRGPPDRPPGRFTAPGGHQQRWSKDWWPPKSKGKKARERNQDIERYGTDPVRKAQRLERNRSFYVQVPTGLGARPAPLLIALHAQGFQADSVLAEMVGLLPLPLTITIGLIRVDQ
eukprot:Skav213857  [mRNA]  locus=scaffold2366:208492:218366:- [translate_table: standard]